MRPLHLLPTSRRRTVTKHWIHNAQSASRSVPTGFIFRANAIQPAPQCVKGKMKAGGKARLKQQQARRAALASPPLSISLFTSLHLSSSLFTLHFLLYWAQLSTFPHALICNVDSIRSLPPPASCMPTLPRVMSNLHRAGCGRMYCMFRVVLPQGRLVHQ